MARSPRFVAALRGERLYAAYLRAIPLLWMAGALTPAAALLLLKLAADRWPRGVMINLVVWSWFAVGLSQAAAAILNGVAIGDLAEGLANAASFSVVGWIFGGLAIAAGASYHLDGPRTLRSVAWVGLYILILAAIAAIAHLSGRRGLYWQTPLGLLLPPTPSAAFYTGLLIFQTEETFGAATTRLVLFFPWATGLGLGGLAIFFISMLERKFWWRLIGGAGGVIGVVFSWSRIAIGALIAVGAILAFLRLPWFWRLTIVGVALGGLFALPLYGIDLLDRVLQMQDSINDARAGSSLARELIYQKSYEGFLQSPIIGHGWIGESVHPKENLPIGSHSTIYGLLYTGGAPTLAAFVFAMVMTFAALISRLMTIANDDAQRSHVIVGLGLAFCLAAYCRYEALYSLTLPCVFLFTFIGAAINADQSVGNAIPWAAATPPEMGRPLRPATSPQQRALKRRPGARAESAFGNGLQSSGD